MSEFDSDSLKEWGRVTRLLELDIELKRGLKFGYVIIKLCF
jgi:hypothetical protein